MDTLFASLIDEARGHYLGYKDIYLNIYKRRKPTRFNRSTRPNRPIGTNRSIGPRPTRTDRPRSTKLNRPRISKAYKRRPFDGPFCGHCMTTTHKTADCWYLYPEKRPFK